MAIQGCKCGAFMAFMINVNGWKCKKCGTYYLYDPLADQWVWLRPLKEDEPVHASPVQALPDNLVALPDIPATMAWLDKELELRPETVAMEVRADPREVNHLDIVARTDHRSMVKVILGDFCMALRAGKWKK